MGTFHGGSPRRPLEVHLCAGFLRMNYMIQSSDHLALSALRHLFIILVLLLAFLLLLGKVGDTSMCFTL